MIGCLKGQLIESSENKILILTNSGIGYEVFYSGDVAFQSRKIETL